MKTIQNKKKLKLGKLKLAKINSASSYKIKGGGEVDDTVGKTKSKRACHNR